MGTVLECGWYTQGPGFSLCQQIIIANSFLVRPGTLSPPSLLHVGIFSGLSLCISVCCGSLCEFICAWVLLGLEDAVSLESAITISHSLPTSGVDPQTLGGGLCWRVPLRSECSKVSSSVHIAQLWVSVLGPVYRKKKLLWWGLSDTLIGVPVSVAAVGIC